MCKCNECDKKDTENCVRIMESCTAQQTETMKDIEIICLKSNYDELIRGTEKIIKLLSSESFWKIRSIEQEKRN